MRDALLSFPEHWIDAQSVLDKERLGGMVAFEIIFAILTAGMGTAAAKSKHLTKANQALQQASKLLRRKRLNTQSRVDLKPDSKSSTPTNLDTQVDTKKLALEEKPKVVPDTPDQTILSPGSKGGWNKALNRELKPNHRYIVGSYTYHTDELGRVRKVSGKLDLKAMDRNTYQQTKAGKAGGIKDGLDADEGGHLIASIFKGPGEQINYAAMDGNLNKGAWQRMETKWAEALKKDPPQVVEVEINAIYDGASKRPEAFEVEYMVDGELFEVMLENKPGG